MSIMDTPSDSGDTSREYMSILDEPADSGGH